MEGSVKHNDNDNNIIMIILKYNNNHYIITDTETSGWLKEGLLYGMVIFSCFFYLLSHIRTHLPWKIEYYIMKILSL